MAERTEESMFDTLPNIWWINTPIPKGFNRKPSKSEDAKLEKAFKGKGGAVYMKQLTGCDSFDALTEKVRQIYQGDEKSIPCVGSESYEIVLPDTKAPYFLKHNCFGIGYGFYFDPAKASNLRNNLKNQIEKYKVDLREYEEALEVYRSSKRGEKPEEPHKPTKKAYHEQIGISAEDDGKKPGSTAEGVFNYITRMVCEVKPGDIIWMRDRERGTYYIGQVTEKSRWVAVHSEGQNLDSDLDPAEAVFYDVANQYSDVIWSGPLTIAQVPGSVEASSSRQQGSFHAVGEKGKPTRITAQWLSMHLMNKQIEDHNILATKYDIGAIAKKEKGNEFHNDSKSFYSILLASDVEDLLALWLYSEKGYIVFPSTNKTSTAGYEFEMVRPKDQSKKGDLGERCYIQCKNGKLGKNEKLNVNDYAELSKKGEVYILLTVKPRENIEGIAFPDTGEDILVSPPDQSHVHCFTEAGVDELFKWAGKEENRNWLPNRIVDALELLEEIDRIRRE